MIIAATNKSQKTKEAIAKGGAKINVADYIERQLDLCGKNQREVASEVGFPKPNMISMLKTGATKVPMTKVVPLAKALGVDKMFFMRLVMNEYQPETWQAIEDAMGPGNVLSENEVELIHEIREAGVANPKIRNDKDRDVVRAAIRALTSD